MTAWNDPPTYGIPDPQDVPPLCYCAHCGGEVYPGEDAYTDTPDAPGSPGSVTLHKDCLMEWVRALGDDPVAEKFGFESLNS